ncbi:MAG TPA: type IVB secretion system protein IcmH/DotU [bacterium]|nr:type IVB secretion system protein IcmH/DotU [bacterium]
MERDHGRSARRRVQTLPDLASSLFSLTLSLRASSGYGSEPELRARIGEYLDRIDQQGHEAGIPREDLEAAKFPLIAFIDETILNSHWESRDVWRERPLQLDRYGETVAGERFFERLDKLRAQGPAKAELLEIYYLCLALGFEGKYKILGKDKLRALVEEVRRDLGYSRPLSGKEPISPHGRRKETRRSSAEDAFPWMRVGAICLGSLVGVFLILYFVIGHRASAALQKLGTLPG